MIEKRKKTEIGIPSSGTALVWVPIVFITLFAPIEQTWADGGMIQMKKTAGPFVITVYTASAPLRAGPIDISVMIQNAEDAAPVLDAQVLIQMRQEAGLTVSSPATREAAQNKLLYAATMKIPEAGQWQIEVTIQWGEQTVKVSEKIAVAPSRSLLLLHWRSLALPPIVIFFFFLNQWLKRRRRSLSSTGKRLIADEERPDD